ncbi:MAG: hypothetical protein M3546_00040 [Actinomycetota bacterium]|nr:hypothetical protein [Actinomycetota bacterium]
MRSVRLAEVFAAVERAVPVAPTDLYQMVGVRSFGGGCFASAEISGSGTRYPKLLRLAAGDFVYPKLMAWEGAFAFVPESLAGGFVSPEFCTFEVNQSAADPRYLEYLFQRPETWQEVAGNSAGTNVRRRRLYPAAFLEYRIPLPDTPEQRRTVARLDALLGQAKDIDRRLETSDPARIVSVYPGIVEHTLARETTQWQPVGDVVDFVNDLVRPGEPTEPAEAFVGLQHIESHTGRRTGSIPLGGEKGRKFRFRPGDVVYGYLRPYLNKVWVADIHGLCSVDQYVLRPKNGIPASYVAHALRSRSTLEQAISMTHSLQLPRLRSGLLVSIEIPLVLPGRVRDVTDALDRGLARIVEARTLRSRQAALAEGLIASVLNRAFAGLQ